MPGIEFSTGKYVAEVLEQTWTRSSTGNRMLILKVRPKGEIMIVGGKRTVSGIESATKRTIYMAITKATAEIALKKLRNAGFEGQKWSELNLVGSEVQCDVGEELYNNAPRERWDLSLGGEVENLPEVASELDAELPIASMAASVTRGAAPVPGDEDIPF